MLEFAKLITLECAYQYWREACGNPTREVYYMQRILKASNAALRTGA